MDRLVEELKKGGFLLRLFFAQKEHTQAASLPAELENNRGKLFIIFGRWRYHFERFPNVGIIRSKVNPSDPATSSALRRKHIQVHRSILPHCNGGENHP
jgi:hypothetical protein